MKWKNKLIQNPDIVVIGVITFLLQIISFVTTLQGAKIYIGNVFPCASLFFAIAIQFCVWYFANTLSGKRHGLKIVALAAAVGCSTWFSFTGIYNLINSPTIYLEERYNSIREELLSDGENSCDHIKELLKQDITDAAYKVGIQKTKLQAEKERLDSCRDALNVENTVTASNKMKAPKQSQYETYEDYVAAYKAYVEAYGQASGAELNAARDQILSSYGFSSMESYENAVRENSAALSELMLVADSESSGIELASECIKSVETGTMPSEALLSNIDNLFSAANQGTDQIIGRTFLIRLKACVNYYAQSDMISIAEFSSKYGIEKITIESAMEYKAAMDTEIASEKRRLTVFLNTVQADLTVTQKQFTNIDTTMTEVYLLPLQALLKGGATNPAYYCFGIAALIDGMTLLLALSNLTKKPVWDRKWKQQPDYTELWEQITCCTPANLTTKEYIDGFLAHFTVSERTLFRGYLLYAKMDDLLEYSTLTALLCDSSHALATNHELFLKADIVYWLNAGEKNYQNNTERNQQNEYMESDFTNMPSSSSSHFLPSEDAASM